jgi:hypothetical protein
MGHKTYTSLTRGIAFSMGILLLNACSVGQMVARSSIPLVESGNVAMNRETDIELARDAIPANLKLVESLIQELPGNAELRLQAAQGFYGYAYGFIEDENSVRASELYRRGFEHALKALAAVGLKGDIHAMPLETIQTQLSDLGRSAVPALFWSASCWAKWIDMNRTEPARIADLAKAAALMQRVLDLDDTYYYGGAHIFFGVYYGGRPPMLGGNLAKSAVHFENARALTNGKLLIVDLLQAQYLERQRFDRKQFHDRLTAVINASPDIFPEMALANAIAQHKAKWMLKNEEEWF